MHDDCEEKAGNVYAVEAHAEQEGAARSQARHQRVRAEESSGGWEDVQDSASIAACDE